MIETIKTTSGLHNEIINGWFNENYHLVLAKKEIEIEFFSLIICLNNEGFCFKEFGIETRMSEMTYDELNFLIMFIPEFTSLLRK